MSKLCIINENCHLVRVTDDKTLRAVIEHLLDDWENGDEDLDGVCGFMLTQGIDFGITDEEVDECTDVSGFAFRIRVWLELGATDEQQVGFLTALEPAIRVRSRDHISVHAALSWGYDLIEDEGEDEDEDPDGND